MFNNRKLETHLEIWHMLLWVFFVIWTVVGFAVMPFGIGADEIREWVKIGGLREALVAIESVSDPIWILLAAATVYLSLAKVEGFHRARIIALIIIIGSAILEIIGEKTNIPFGPYDYTDEFGARLFGTLPFTIPLAWLIVVVAGRHLMLRFAPGIAHWKHALGVGGVALLTDINLEFIAWQVRYYWIWYPLPFETPAHGWPPIQNFVSWFVFASLLAYVIPRPPAGKAAPYSGRIILVLVLMNALFLFTHIVRFFR